MSNKDERQTATARRKNVHSAHPVEGLRVAHTGDVFWLPPDGADFTVGAESDCSVVIDEPHVSRVHCIIERRDDATFVRDNNSKNGTMLDGVRCDRAEIVDGSTISLGASRLVAVSRQTQRTHDSLRQLLGWGAGALSRVDAAMGLARTHAHLLLMGEPGTEPERLAMLIHESSSRAHRRFVEWPEGIEAGRAQGSLLESAADGTLYSELAHLPQRRERLIEHLLNDDFNLRFIGSAPGRTEAVKSVGADLASLMMGLEIPALRTRIDDLPRLILVMFRELCADVGRCPTLTEADIASLRAYPWPKNLEELRRTIQYITALSIHGSSRTAADALQVARSTLKNRLRRIGLDDGPRELRPL